MSDSALLSRWRFSIRTLLGWTVVLALAITVWMQWRELGPLREEVQRLRDEGGHLTIEDPDLPHAIRVALSEPDHWRWRVHVPVTGHYKLCFQQGKIPTDGLPTQSSDHMTFPLEPGEHRLDIVLEFKGGDLPQHTATLSTPNGRLGMLELFETTEDWLDVPKANVDRLADFKSIGYRTQSFSPGEPIILLRYRAQNAQFIDPPTGDIPSKFTIESVPTPSDGLMLWIERIP